MLEWQHDFLQGFGVADVFLGECNRREPTAMKTIIPVLLVSLTLSLPELFAQDDSNPPPGGRTAQPGGGFRGGGGGGGGRGGGFGGFGGARGFGTEAGFAQFDTTQQVKFDLDFPGGTASQLVAAIEKASSKPLNAIIPVEFREAQLPSLRMKSVTVPQLFQALQMASMKEEPLVTGTRMDNSGNRINTVSYQNTGYGFRTPEGADPQNPVWYFFVARPVAPPLFEKEAKMCRFYQLGGYLASYTIDDITTAIQTGWKMLGETSPPTLNFHKDTGLLIAVGDPDKLKLIDAVLTELRGTAKPAKNAPAPAKSAPSETK
jgi:hypothetical protein